MTCTTFNCTTDLVFTTARTPEFLRNAERNITIGNCTIANRSNYTRVTFKGDGRAAFLVPAGPYAFRVNAMPLGGATANILGLRGERVGMALSASEMRAMAYGLLAAANWIDSRDTDGNRKHRKPTAAKSTLAQG